MKISVVIPVYFNEDNLVPLYEDMKDKLFSQTQYEWEIMMVNDGSGDNSYGVMRELAAKDDRLKICSLSRNFGSDAAVLCGLARCTGDCAVVKAADLQEPTELVLDMVESWKKGNNVVLAVRKGREEGKVQTMFSNLYYWLVRKTAFPQMPKGGFDVFWLLRGFLCPSAAGREKQRHDGADLVERLPDGLCLLYTPAEGDWEKPVDFAQEAAPGHGHAVQLFHPAHFGGTVHWDGFLRGCPDMGGGCLRVIMLTLGILGEYLWRTFDASRNRPPYIAEDDCRRERGGSPGDVFTETGTEKGDGENDKDL